MTGLGAWRDLGIGEMPGCSRLDGGPTDLTIEARRRYVGSEGSHPEWDAFTGRAKATMWLE